MKKNWPLLWIPCLEKYLCRGRQKKSTHSKTWLFRWFSLRTWQKLSLENKPAECTLLGGLFCLLSSLALKVWYWDHGCEEIYLIPTSCIKKCVESWWVTPLCLRQPGWVLWNQSGLGVSTQLWSPLQMASEGSRRWLAHRTIISGESCSKKQRLLNQANVTEWTVEVRIIEK